MVSINRMEKITGSLFDLYYFVESEEDCFCRFCRKQIKNGEEVYVCPADKLLCCLKCREKDNEYPHAKKYYKKPDFQHIHYYALYKQTKKKEDGNATSNPIPQD